jgi:hypothetical protein
MPRTTKRTGVGKKELLKDRGLKRVPKGKEVHHRNPLSKGGSDTKRNVSLISKQHHRQIHKKK